MPLVATFRLRSVLLLLLLLNSSASSVDNVDDEGEVGVGTCELKLVSDDATV